MKEGLILLHSEWSKPCFSVCDFQSSGHIKLYGSLWPALSMSSADNLCKLTVSDPYQAQNNVGATMDPNFYHSDVVPEINF